jgi:hypothetical protein
MKLASVSVQEHKNSRHSAFDASFLGREKDHYHVKQKNFSEITQDIGKFGLANMYREISDDTSSGLSTQQRTQLIN